MLFGKLKWFVLVNKLIVDWVMKLIMFIDLMMIKKFFFLGWCVVDDEDHEEDDGRRRKKMNNINPNVFWFFVTERTKTGNEDKDKVQKQSFF